MSKVIEVSFGGGKQIANDDTERSMMRVISGPFNEASIDKILVAVTDGIYRPENFPDAVMEMEAGDAIILHKDGKLESQSHAYFAAQYPEFVQP